MKDPFVAAFDRFARARLERCEGEQVAIDLCATEAASRMRVEFVTPTELKVDGEVTDRPEFGLLFARVRDRVAILRRLYGAGSLDIDFAGIGERASAVRRIEQRLEHVDVERRSSRTGQRHSIGGFVGHAEYGGDLAEFVPYLRAGEWTGVGRQTVWGKGAIRIIMNV
jgi:CRISPR/Cas system endoribonuclease Cas6 (RAMP superfamily)